jgi:quercetin dioxygenase-like cupin family protein
MSMQTAETTDPAGTAEPAGPAWRPTPVRSNIVAAGDGRTPAPLNIVGEETLVKVSPEDSDGLLAFFHLVAPPMSGPPRHVHSREDELFYVLEGELVFELDGARHTVRAGDTVYLRRGVVHTYQNFTTSDVRLLIATTPGMFCNLFVELSAATPPGTLPDFDLIDAISAKYGITRVGPPMFE